MNKELCIRCSKPTPYDINTPITLRRYFVEGSGQLCPLCYQELYGVAGALGVPFGIEGARHHDGNVMFFPSIDFRNP